MLEHIQADVWVRYQRCAATRLISSVPTMPTVRRSCESTAAWYHTGADDWRNESGNQTDFAGFNISYDNYHSTHSKRTVSCLSLSILAWKRTVLLKPHYLSVVRPGKRHVPAGSFVKGTCPKCKAPDQYGDNCESAAQHIARLNWSSRNRWFLAYPGNAWFRTLLLWSAFFQRMLQAWTRSGALQEQVANKMQNGLNPACNSGISPEMRLTSVWNSERAGQIFLRLAGRADWHMGSFKNLCDKRGDTTSFDETGRKTPPPSCTTSSVKILFTPQPVLACHAGRQQLPQADQLFVHGYVTVNGAKMSKSRGTLLKPAPGWIILTPTACVTTTCETFFAHWWYRSQPGGFRSGVNADIVNKVVNLASRNAGFSTSVLTACWQANWLTRNCTNLYWCRWSDWRSMGKPRIW